MTIAPVKDKKGNEIYEHRQECQYVFKQCKIQGCVVYEKNESNVCIDEVTCDVSAVSIVLSMHTHH